MIFSSFTPLSISFLIIPVEIVDTESKVLKIIFSILKAIFFSKFVFAIASLNIASISKSWTCKTDLAFDIFDNIRVWIEVRSVGATCKITSGFQKINEEIEKDIRWISLLRVEGFDGMYNGHLIKVKFLVLL